MAEKCIFVKEDGTRCQSWSMKDSEYCYIHDDPENASKAGAKGGRKTKYEALEPSGSENPTDILIRAVKQLESMHPSPEVLRTLTAAASAYDRAVEREASRGSDIVKIEVEYVNDWRGSQAS